MRDVGIALVGLGTVGSGVHKVLNTHKGHFRKKVGANLSVKSVLEKDARRLRKLGVKKNLAAKSIKEVVANPEVDVVVELIGGIKPAKDYILQAIASGKHVVTANKELMATSGKEILQAAEKNNVDVYFEASVGGGIPVVRPLKECLAGNKIEQVLGIVNGTTNYILTQMSLNNCSFKEALAQAKEKGYAERNPTADIEGKDAAAKIAILASIAFNSRVVVSQVYTEGISKVTPTDIAYADEIGCVVKLIALAKEEKGELDVRVHPTMIPKTHPLAAVNGVYNAIFVKGDAVGEVMFFGQGAGSLPAASAVVGDIIEVARHLRLGGGSVGCTCFEKKRVKSIEEITSAYYLLMSAVDRPGVLAKISRAFGDANVSLASVIQRGPRGKSAELMFITHLVQERNLRKSLKVIEKLDVVDKVLNVIRVEASQ